MVEGKQNADNSGEQMPAVEKAVPVYLLLHFACVSKYTREFRIYFRSTFLKRKRY
jgi:hypothetical protein